MKHNYINKRLSLMFGTALLSSVAIAQPTLDSTNNATIIGESMTYYVADSNVTNYSGTNGASAVWNYSNLWGYGTTVDNDVVDASTTTYASDYPNSDIADEMQGSMIIYRNTTADSSWSQGYVLTIPGMGEATITLTDDLKTMEYPFNFMDAFTDDLDGEASVNISPFPVPYSGTVNVEADAYGTINIAGTTFNNVLRVMTSEDSEADASLLGGGIIPIDRLQFDYYDPATSKFPIFRHITMTINGTASSVVYSSVPLPLSDNEIAQSVSMTVAPNPADNAISIQLNSSVGNNANIYIVNAVGQVVLQEQARIVAGNNTIQQDISGLSAGIYFVKVHSGNAISTQKIYVK